ncbi:hypothetical protein [Xanthomonas translucens]|uniref:hypothetical protein n=1 Tax=Xanthomonas campestris pv. translucens TaxID=343 RepID=UPI00071E6E7F|nr:hypothetical protein [Xanthomonas translucens]OAX58021.1 hypothetical protein A6R79_14790 [Xanthomonas translucens pv. translucens]UNU11543.1 hypothetical protein KBV71_01310 [Xanthomonas translucens pv. translucens]
MDAGRLGGIDAAHGYPEQILRSWPVAAISAVTGHRRELWRAPAHPAIVAQLAAYFRLSRRPAGHAGAQ